MPVYNLTVGSGSPFMQYSGNWTLSRFTAQSSPGSTFTLSFSGTGIHVYGNSSGTSSFSASLDGSFDTYTATNNGQVSNGNDLNPPMVLFSRSGLSSGWHTLSFKHAFSTQATGSFSVNSVNITAGDGNPGTSASETMLDDSGHNFTFHTPPGGAWSYDPLPGPLPYSTVHSTFDPSASANISFYGNEISLYGTMPDAGTVFSQPEGITAAYQVGLDGQTPIAVSGTSATAIQGVIDDALLYNSGPLPLGLHYAVLSLTTVGSNEDGPLLIDYATVKTYSSSANMSSSATSPTGQESAAATGSSLPSQLPTSHISSSTPIISIVGGVVGAVLVMALLFGASFLVLRRRFRRARLTFAANDGIDGVESETAETREHDMAPPDYELVYSHRSGPAAGSDPAMAETPTDSRDSRRLMWKGLLPNGARSPPKPSLGLSPAQSTLDGDKEEGAAPGIPSKRSPFL